MKKFQITVLCYRAIMHFVFAAYFLAAECSIAAMVKRITADRAAEIRFEK